MKNKVLLPIILLLGLTLAGCDGQTTSSVTPSSETPSSEAPSSENPSSENPSSEAPVEYGVAISNKTELAEEWHVGEAQRSLNVTLTPEANPLVEIQAGNLVISSSDSTVVSVSGVTLTALKAGTAKVTLTYHEKTDEVDLTVLAKVGPMSKYGTAHEGTAEDPFTNEDALIVAKHHEDEDYVDEAYYVKGEIASFYHAPGSRTDGAVSWFLKPAQDGGEKFEVYKCFKDGGAFLTDDDVWVNGTAVAYGKFTHYNAQYETSSATFVSCEGNKPAARQVVEKTFAEALTAVKALADGGDTYDYYKVDAYVSKKSGDNYFLTATKGETLADADAEKANAIELYNATGEGVAAKLTKNAKVTIQMVLKNYHGQVENLLGITADQITVVEAGGTWEVIPEPAVTTRTLAEFIAGENTKAVAYNVTAKIKSFKNAGTKDKYGNMTLTDDTNDLIIYGSTMTATALAWNDADAYVFTNPQDFMTNETSNALNIGDTVTMKLIRCDYTKDAVTTIEGCGIITDIQAGVAPTVEDVTDVDAVSTVKTVSQVLAATAADNTLIAKVTGVAEHLYGQAKYGNFYLTDPATGDAIVIYGGYTDTTFEVTDGTTYSAKSHSTAVTDAIIGHTVTVYGTIGYHDNKGQLVDTLVQAGDAYTGATTASVSVNDALMGSAVLSSTTPNYGADVTVTATPNSGYKVDSVKVTRANGSQETLTAPFTFKAEVGNAVLVTFAADDAPLNAAMAKGANAYDDVTVNGNDDVIKCGTSSKAGVMTITLAQAGATTVSFYIAGWNGDSVTVDVTAEGATVSPTQLTPVSDTGLTGSGTSFTLAAEESTYLTQLTLTGATAGTVITLTANKASKCRFFVWGATYVVA